MGRSQEYDRNRVLAGAAKVFRDKGYHAVSIKDLENTTGLKGGSIYHAFGDKAGLFAAAFEHYNDKVLGRRIETYAPAQLGLDGLRQLFLTLLEEPGGTSFGCLITNTAVEFGADHLPAGAAAGLHHLAALFVDRLESAQRAGRLTRHLATDAASAKLLALYQGVLVLIRAGWDKRQLKTLIDAEFDQLEGQRDT